MAWECKQVSGQNLLTIDGKIELEHGQSFVVEIEIYWVLYGPTKVRGQNSGVKFINTHCRELPDAFERMHGNDFMKAFVQMKCQINDILLEANSP